MAAPKKKPAPAYDSRTEEERSAQESLQANTLAAPTPTSGSQPAQSPTTYNANASANLADDIARRNGAAEGGFQSSIAGMDLGGQFAPRGTTPSQMQIAASNLAAAGASGATQASSAGYTNLGVSRPQMTASGPTPGAGIVPQLSGAPGQAPSKVETAADQAGDALGATPRVDMGVADRRLGEYQESLGMSREVIDRLLNGPSTAERLGSQVLRSQLAMARSAAGGPGAVQQAFSAAQQQAPELQATATEQARQEEMQKLTAAGTVASNFAQAALGARGQDVNIAGKNVDAGLQMKGLISQLSGVQLELDQKNTELMGQMARDLAAMQFDWASLTAQQADAALDRYLQIYGIDANIRAQMSQLKQSQKITGKDILNGIVGVVGAGATIAATAFGGPVAGAAVGAGAAAASQAV